VIFLPPNLASANLHPKIIDLELLNNFSADQMSGPLSTAKASAIFNSFFAPHLLAFLKKIPGDGIWCMIRQLSKQDDDGQSTNDWVDSEKLQSTYFTASSFALHCELSCFILP